VDAEGLDRYPRTTSGQLARTRPIRAGGLDNYSWNLQHLLGGAEYMDRARLELRLPLASPVDRDPRTPIGNGDEAP
jgi:hypothetical protein